MTLKLPVGISMLSIGLSCAFAAAQAPATVPTPDGTQTIASAAPAADDRVGSSPVPLEWTPPALEQLSAHAAVKSNFTLDRAMLGLAADLLPESETEDRRAINKLDGVSVHIMRFGDTGIPDEAEVAAVRAAYHLRGWKHLVTTTRVGGPVHSGTTDVWLVLDGVNVRGAVVLAETPKSLTLVTVAGNLSPVELMHLGGHFGIPRFDEDSMKGATNR